MNELQILSDIAKVGIIEDEFKKHPQIELEVKHYFAPGVYIRQLNVPKGVALTGKIHKYNQFHLLLKGDLSVLIDDEIQRLKAPCIIMSPAGAKRVAFAHEDTVWLMVHGTNEVDIDKIEEHFIAETEEEFLEFINQQLMLPL